MRQINVTREQIQVYFSKLGELLDEIKTPVKSDTDNYSRLQETYVNCLSTLATGLNLNFRLEYDPYGFGEEIHSLLGRQSFNSKIITANGNECSGLFFNVPNSQMFKSMIFKNVVGMKVNYLIQLATEIDTHPDFYDKLLVINDEYYEKAVKINRDKFSDIVRASDRLITWNPFNSINAPVLKVTPQNIDAMIQLQKLMPIAVSKIIPASILVSVNSKKYLYFIQRSNLDYKYKASVLNIPDNKIEIGEIVNIVSAKINLAGKVIV